jgi:hypothetical protein
MTEWCRQLGASHQRRDDSVRDQERTRLDCDRERQGAMRRRWPTIAAAIRTLVKSYNEGVGLEALTVVDRADRDLTIDVVARGGQTLTMELDGAELYVRPNEGTAGSPDGGKRWLTFDLSDEATAAYALQHWMTRL